MPLAMPASVPMVQGRTIMPAGGAASAGDAGADVGFGVLANFGVRAGRAEELFDQAVAAAELQFFGEDAQRSFRRDEVNVGDAGVGVEGAEHFCGEDGAAGAGDGEGEAEGWRGGFGGAGHESDYRLNRRVSRADTFDPAEWLQRASSAESARRG